MPANTSTWFTANSGKHYRLYTTGKTWWNAMLDCNSRSGYMVTYYTQQEQIDVEVGTCSLLRVHSCMAHGGAPSAHACRELCRRAFQRAYADQLLLPLLVFP